jgi:hypothetical protein
MVKIHDRLFIGSIQDCCHQKEGWAVVHACKTPCHQKAVGYQGSLPGHHPNYLVLERPDNLYLNMIDPSEPLFMPPLFTEFLRFAQQHWEAGKNLLIHCNRGDSRAPSLALLFLSKVVGALPTEGYWEAWQEFFNLYPNYLPGQGLQIYLGQNWGRF